MLHFNIKPFHSYCSQLCLGIRVGLIEFVPQGICLGAMWSEAGNWIQVKILHVVIKVARDRGGCSQEEWMESHMCEKRVSKVAVGDAGWER